MSIENVVVLKKQLERQAEMLCNEKNNVKLVQSILSTCFALLRVADNIMPNTFSIDEFNGIYAGYLGIVNKINSFYNCYENYFVNTNSSIIKDLLASIDSLENEKKTLDIQASQLITKVAEENNLVKLKISEIENEKRKLSELKLKIDELEIILSEKKSDVLRLEQDVKIINTKISNFDADLEKLLLEIANSKIIYGDLVSYFIELERFESGIKEEGYVDFNSFSKMLHDMNVQGEELIMSYDKALKNITIDIEELQRKIEIKRRAGAFG